MKNLYHNPKFTHRKLRALLGLCFLAIMAVSILSHSSLFDGLEVQPKVIHLFAAQNMFELGWIPACILLLGYYPYIFFKQKHEKEKLRIKIASDLHDDLGSILNSVNIYTELALIKGEATYLEKIKEGTQEAINGVRNIIWQLDDKDTSFPNLISRINHFASFLCQVKQITFKAEIGKDAFTYKLDEEEKRNLYLIIKEAINNSVKYASGNEIKLSITIEKRKPVIILSDNGKGYNESTSVSGNGIRNMKARAKDIRYHISIDSQAGTKIQLQKL